MSFKYVDGIPTNVLDIPLDLDTLTYKVQIVDNFIDSETVDPATTNATKSGACYILEYDNEAITVVANAVTIASTPNFTVQVGDIIRQGSNFTSIVTVNSQTEVVVADGSVLSNASATISQCVHTLNLNEVGDASAKTRPIDIISSNIPQALVLYYDDTARATGTNANVGYVASSDGFTNYSNVQQNEDLPTDTTNSISFGTAGTDLRLKFFSNITTGQGTVKLTGYKCSFHE